jgi:flagellar biogenesis protein FliO
MDDSILKAFGSLVTIVAVLGVILFFLKKYSKKMKKNKPDSINLEIVSKIALQPKTYLFIVKAGDKTLLVGANDHSISNIADLSEPQHDNRLPAQKSINYLNKSLVNTTQNHAPAKNIKQKETVDTDLSFGSFIKTAFKKN